MVSINEIIGSLNYLAHRLSELENVKKSLQEQLISYEEKHAKSKEAIETIQETRQYYRKAIDIVYEKSVGELEKTLNAAISFIFEDKDYYLRLNLEDKRGKSLQLDLEDGQGNAINIKDGVGMGVRTIISAILQIFYLTSKGSYTLFIDEKYSYISENYVQRFFEFLSKMCKQSGFKLVVISHDPRFFEYADSVISVNDGIVKVEK